MARAETEEWRVGVQSGGAPGVYVERLTPVAPPGPWRTDIAGFVGLAEKGDVTRAVRIESQEAFRARFGDPVAGTYLAHAVRGFFANGGRACWIVRAARFKVTGNGEVEVGQFAVGELAFDAGSAVASRVTGSRYTPLRLTVRALSPGDWATGLHISIYAAGPDLVAMVVWSKGSESYPLDRTALELLRNGREVRVGDVAITRQLWPMLVAQPIEETKLALESAEQCDSSNSRKASVEDFIGDPTQAPRRGLALLSEIAEISMIAVPDIFALHLPADMVATRDAAPVASEAEGDPYRRFFHDGRAHGATTSSSLYLLSTTERAQVRAALVGQAATLRDRVAILDTPPDDPFLRDEAGFPRSTNAACYTPWLRIRRLRDRAARLAVPPCGHVAGRIAQNDREFSVASPPANLDLNDVADVATKIIAERHASLNDRGVNVIRPFFGSGIRIMGARTFSHDTPEFRYFHARRLVAMVSDVLFARAHWMVFEPHDEVLWRAAARVLSAVLFDFWRDGLLSGERRDDAFFVRCDADTNPPAEREVGRLYCLIGVRPPPPAEFIVLRFGLTRGGFETLPVEAGQMYR